MCRVSRATIALPSWPLESDRVEDLVLHAQHARHQVEMARDQLRFEQLAEAAAHRSALPSRIGFVRRAASHRRGRSSPARTRWKFDVADLGAVEAFHAGGNRAWAVIGLSVGRAYAPRLGCVAFPEHRCVGMQAPTYAQIGMRPARQRFPAPAPASARSRRRAHARQPVADRADKAPDRSRRGGRHRYRRTARCRRCRSRRR